MIVLNVKIETNPGTVAALKDAVAAMEKASRAEPGCIEYVFSTELNEPEQPPHHRALDKTSTALKTHFTLPHMATFNAAMQKHPPKSRGRKDVRRDVELPFPPQ